MNEIRPLANPCGSGSRLLATLLLVTSWTVSNLPQLHGQPIVRLLATRTTPFGSMLEFQIDHVPRAANPFDPDRIRVDAEVTQPDGQVMAVPAFAYQAFSRRLANGAESLTPLDSISWRLRFTPRQSGPHTLQALVQTPDAPTQRSASIDFEAKSLDQPDSVVPKSVPPSPRAAADGFPRVGLHGQYLETMLGKPLPLLGWNVCWHGRRGTADYDEWLPALARAGAQFARLWMAPWAFGIENAPGERLQYRLDRAWQLDYVFNQALDHGIYLMLCLDYHGMFESEPDYWGGNNHWPNHPYHQNHGGPCLNAHEFFTRPEALRLYQKRLRYLIARFAAYPNLLAWEFFNEIDNVYRHLKPDDVVRWHETMGQWLHQQDPFQHLVTSSLTGGSDRAEFWRVKALDFAQYHSYGMSKPAMGLAAVSQSMLQNYRKPVLIGEYGTDWRGWGRTNDPFLRGFRQGLWGGALGGSAGSAMSWWWENVHAENLYPTYQAMRAILTGESWGEGTWTPVTFLTSEAPPVKLGTPHTNATPFVATLLLDPTWGARPGGMLALADRHGEAHAPSVLNSFVHGTSHADLRVPMIIETWLATPGQLTLHLNSVSSGAILSVRTNNTQALRRPLPNRDGGWQVNQEYDEDIVVALAPGRQQIEIRNTGADWFFLDWIRIESVQPAAYDPPWVPSPHAIGLSRDHQYLVYVVNPLVSFPANARSEQVDPLNQAVVTLTNAVRGDYRATWHRPSDGTIIASQNVKAFDNSLTLPLPSFREDLAGHIVPLGRLEAVRSLDTPEIFLTAFASHFPVQLETSTDLATWMPKLPLTPTNDAEQITIREKADAPASFFRARLQDKP